MQTVLIDRNDWQFMVPIDTEQNIWSGPCPRHAAALKKEREVGPFSVDLDKNIFHCLICGATGGPLHFVSWAYSLSRADAIDYLLELTSRQDSAVNAQAAALIELEKTAAWLHALIQQEDWKYPGPLCHATRQEIARHIKRNKELVLQLRGGT